MGGLLSDLQYAFRRLRQAPGFSAIVILTLALGIGANSAIFSVVNTVLLRPLPYREPGRLVTIFHHYPSLNLDASVSAVGFRDYHDRTHSFSSVAVSTGWGPNLTGLGEPERMAASRVSGEFFATLGVNPQFGRSIIADDDQPGHQHVIVLSHAVWQRLFGAKADVVGRQVQLNGEAYQVIGVMPERFVDPWNPQADIWVPLALDLTQLSRAQYTNEYLTLIARLKPGVSVDQAAREMTGFAEQLKKDTPDQFPPDWTLTLRSVNEVRMGSIRSSLLILLGAVGFVLLIACANVANLMLARSASRQREIAIRTALGARTMALVRQLLTESVVLAAAGGALGLALAWASVRGLVALHPSNLPRVDELGLDGRVVAFTAFLSIATGLAFGLVPAIQAGRTDLQAALKEAGRGGTGDRFGHLTRRVLVVAEIALALTLLAGGGLLLRSFARVARVDPGFNPDHVLTFNLSLPAAKYRSDTTQRAFWRSLYPRLAAIPGVKAAGGTSVLPFGGNWSTASFNVEGYTPPPNGNGPWGDIRVVSPGFFQALEIGLVRGRYLDENDRAGSAPAVVVDEEFVKRFYPAGTDPVGRRIWFGPPTPDSTVTFFTIAGVVRHTAHEGLDAAARIQVYFAVDQSGPFGGQGGSSVVVRTAGEPMAAVSAVRAAIHELDPDLPLARIAPMSTLVENSLGQRRLSAILLGVFAGMALLLAALGIYGVMAYSVAQRVRELGVRLALGASREQVLRLVLGQGMSIAILGAVIGLVGAFGLTRLIASQLYQITATDPPTFSVVTLLLVGVAFIATLVPAWRATRVDPVEVLREE